MPTWDQIKGIIERLILVVLTYAVTKGWIAIEDVATYGPALLALAGAGYAAWVNRPKAIVQSAAALPNTVVVTTPAIASTTPEKNIISTQGRTEEEITRELNQSQL